MDELAFWRQKLLQILHDPPAKPYDSLPGKKGAARGGHKNVAKKIAELLTGVDINYFKGLPDYATAGADRPVFPYGKGAGRQIQVRWPANPLITHPLSPGYRLLLNRSGIDENTAGVKARETIVGLEDGVIDDLEKELSETVVDSDVWNSPSELKKRFFTIWRKLQHILIQKWPDEADEPVFRHLWQTMPADSRCPDHTIWDHNRLTSALAFMTAAKDVAAPRAPWLFRFEIGPVGRFIEEARTSRDLWMGSFLLSDLIFHAMGPVIRRYGPDCIIYPDLRGNPRADVWLKEKYSTALPEEIDNPATYAAVLPNVFTAILPLGGVGYLKELKELANKAKTAMHDRWQKLAEIVKNWLAETQGSRLQDSGEWHEIWKRQHKEVLAATWSAVRWSSMENIVEPESLTYADPLPCQRERSSGILTDQIKKDLESIKRREKRLKPFVSKDVWAHYSHARSVFAATNPKLHQLERGFDYALTHHQLRMRHVLRKQQSAEPGIFDEQGEKCTVCGRRQALYNLNGRPDKLHGHRQASRDFWQDTNENKGRRLNPDPAQQDRLCGVCAMKRFLVEAGVNKDGELDGINPIWAGYGVGVKQLNFNDDIPRVPFPSTATIAAQGFLEEICKEDSLRGHLKAVVANWNKAGLPRTDFARSLNRLAVLENNPDIAQFLMLDTQQSIFPETLDIDIRRAEMQKLRDKANGLKAVRESVRELRKAARDARIIAPNTRIAVIRLDGDHMGRLLLGDPEIIQTTWRDVLHPDAVTSAADDSSGKPRSTLLNNDVTIKAGWPDLLDSKRLMGPSLHAFISRALAVFSHRIAPWVVEREFSGRLIYCGGDDILAMAPADDALHLAARLQQLFSAPFIIDTMPEETPWGWRQAGGSPEHNINLARRRFMVPIKPKSKNGTISLPLSEPDLMEPYLLDDNVLPAMPVDGEILPMLGKGHSLSAGIAYGHFKSPLQGLLRQSKHMLARWAKDLAGRSAIGLSHFSRNGIKTEFAMKWQSDDNTFSNSQRFKEVVDGFRKDKLPKRLPYKLCEHHRLLYELATDDDNKEKLAVFIKGLFMKELGDANLDPKLGAAALNLWQQGLKLAMDEGSNNFNRAADGLLIARNLAGEEEGA